MAVKKSNSGEKIVARAITPDDWKTIELLFGDNGACGGCWCMYWRRERHGRIWEECKGARNKRAFKKLVSGGVAVGCLAFSAGEAVGWCSVGPRADFPRVNRTKGLQTEWDRRTWCVNCFFIKRGWRGRGVATVLLDAAVRLARLKKAKVLEAYPVNVKRGQEMPAAFAYTGVPAMFRKSRFKKRRLPGENRDVYTFQF